MWSTWGNVWSWIEPKKYLGFCRFLVVCSNWEFLFCHVLDLRKCLLVKKKKIKININKKKIKKNWSCVDSCRKTYFCLAFDLKKIWSCLGARSERDFDSARGLWMLLVACSALRRVWWCVRPWEVFNHLSDLSKNLAVCLDLSVLQRVRGLTFKGFWSCGRLLGLGSVF